MDSSFHARSPAATVSTSLRGTRKCVCKSGSLPCMRTAKQVGGAETRNTWVYVGDAQPRGSTPDGLPARGGGKFVEIVVDPCHEPAAPRRLPVCTVSCPPSSTRSRAACPNTDGRRARTRRRRSPHCAESPRPPVRATHGLDATGSGLRPRARARALPRMRPAGIAPTRPALRIAASTRRTPLGVRIVTPRRIACSYSGPHRRREASVVWLRFGDRARARSAARRRATACLHGSRHGHGRPVSLPPGGDR